MSHFTRISVLEADALLLEHPTAILLDIRDKRSFDDSHHPKASLLDDARLHELVACKDKTVPVIIYCYHGNSSRDIARMFSEFGFKHCYSVDGGYAAWRHQIVDSFPVSKSLETWLKDNNAEPGDVNARINSDLQTPLMKAAKQGLDGIVRDLVEAGADPNLTDKQGNNALWYACIGQSRRCVEILINADVEIDNQNHKGFCAINYAVGMDDIFNLLSDCVADETLLRLGMGKPTTTRAPLFESSSMLSHEEALV